MKQESSLLDMLAGITIYHKVKKDKVIKQMVRLLLELAEEKVDFHKVITRYSRVCSYLYRSEYVGNFADYLIDLILFDKNVFTCHCAHSKLVGLPELLKQAAKYDLEAFSRFQQVTSVMVKKRLKVLFPEQETLISQLPDYESEAVIFTEFVSWNDNVKQIAEYHYRNGVSMFAKYPAFYFTGKEGVRPAVSFESVHLDSLKKYEAQKTQVIDNTLSFIHKKPANNVLLYGDRGTGKSTMVSAILTEYRNKGLRMIQIAKEDIIYIHRLLKAIDEIPLRFIIFIDDLTFNENDEAFNTLKAVLEGSLNAMPENVLIYATTNRRHLIKETFSAREGNELHAGDTRDESASLADRFGLTVTFMKPTLPEFLDIVCAIAKERELDVSEETLRKGANTFATRKASRSGRVAKQYVDYVEGRLSLDLPI